VSIEPVAAGTVQALAGSTGLEPATSGLTDEKHAPVFQRYRIVSDDDVRAALARTEQAIKLAPRRRSAVAMPRKKAK
jgi:hypothetical protein